ncbi:MAG: flagellar biosynthetic protein FliR [Proteobacteria bacterium]|nr:flagellar biosynthetic protein FliR [Pseudomonadota bacterium]
MGWLGRFLWPFLRITGVFLTSPLYGSTMIPTRVKAILAATLAGALALWLPDLPPFPGDPPSAIYQGLIQIGYGAAIGLVMQIVVVAVASIGEVAGLAMGLSFAELQFQDVPGSTQVLFDLMTWTGLMGYIALGGPVWLFGAIAHSFAGGVGGLGPATWPALVSFGGVIMTTGVYLAVPVLAVGLAVNITVGLLTVFAPQLNLLTIGFPLLILGGLSVLTISLGNVQQGIEHLLNTAVKTIAAMTHHG